MFDYFEYALYFAIVGFLIAEVLTLEGEVLSWFPKFVRYLIRAEDSPRNWNTLQAAIIKITYNCPKCIAGQLTFWFFVSSIDLQGILFGVPLSIFLAVVLQKYLL